MTGDQITLEELNCSICQETYDQEDGNPRTLMCGHTFCTACLRSIISRGYPAHCPECRDYINFNNVESIPVCYLIKKIVSSVNELNKQFESKVKTPEERNLNSKIPSDGKCSIHDSPKHLLCKPCSVWVCGTCAYFKHCSLNGSSQKNCKVQLSTDVINEEINTQIENISKQKQILNTVSENISQLVSNLIFQVDYNNVDNYEYIMTKEDFIIMSIQALDDVLEMEVETVEDLKKFSTHVKLLFEAHKYPMSEGDFLSEFVQYLVNKRGEFIMTPVYPLQLIFSTEVNGTTLYSTLQYSSEVVLVPALKKNVVIEKKRLIFHISDLFLNNKPVYTYFELVAGSVHLGRVVFKLFDNQRAKQFRLLCTGEKGPCYKGTLFFREDGINNRYISGGDYEFNNGTGGRSLFSVTDDPVMPMTTGIVCGLHSTRSRSLAQFKIFYYVDELHYRPTAAMGVIGKVVKGLRVIQSAVGVYGVINSISIRECGIYFPTSRK